MNQTASSVMNAATTLKMRIGIHSGPVVVGTLGNDLRVEFKAVGDTVNLASRMEDFAEPGATYITEETFKPRGGKLTILNYMVLQTTSTCSLSILGRGTSSPNHCNW
jgi:class 3 adenylate cyclase